MLSSKEKELEVYIKEFLESEKKFDQIVKFIAQDIMNIAYSYVSNYEDAKDISQEIFLKLYKKLKYFKGKSKISTWIYRVSINTCIDFLRKKKKSVSLDERIVKNKEEHSKIEDIEKKDMNEILKKKIKHLPARQKNVIILKHLQGLKISEISKILKCSESSVKTHLCRAIDNLRKNWSKEDE
jgi:RNA polymerase sigma-70 factor (ECF subfamily)